MERYFFSKLYSLSHFNGSTNIAVIVDCSTNLAAHWHHGPKYEEHGVLDTVLQEKQNDDLRNRIRHTDQDWGVVQRWIVHGCDAHSIQDSGQLILAELELSRCSASISQGIKGSKRDIT